MATNFRISAQRRGKDLRLALYGDFDGTAAFELLQTIGQNGPRSGRVVVDTGGLNTVLPFGQAVFRKRYGTIDHARRRIHFTGPLGHRLAPDGAD